MNLADKIKNDEIIKEIQNLFPKEEIYLVGGFLRDLILDKISPDKDIVVINSKSEDIAKTLAEKLDGVKILLDKENQIYRIALKDKENFIDIVEAENFEKDLNRRDFTINSIYYDIKNEKIIDKANGINDIENKIIRTVDINNLKDDPLRMLRAFRFASLYGFKISDDILNFIKENKGLIQNVSAERINYEIIKMFSGKNLIENLRMMNDIEFLKEIFPKTSEINKIPKNSHHHLPLFEHTMEVINSLEIKTLPLLNLGAFMHDIGKPATWHIDENGRHRFLGHDVIGEKIAKGELKKLKFSNKQIEIISFFVRHHMYPALLMKDNNVSEKAKFRFYKKTKEHYRELIDLAKADRLATRGEEVSEKDIETDLKKLECLLEFCAKADKKIEALPKLISGKDVMQILKLKPSKLVGEILEMVEEKRFEGKIISKNDAIEFLKSLK